MTVTIEPTTSEKHAAEARPPSRPDENRPTEKFSEFARLLAQAYIHTPSLIP
jgi:hypothetical protein